MVKWAYKLASAGFVALALDLYGAPFSVAEAMSRHEEMMRTPGLMLARADGGARRSCGACERRSASARSRRVLLRRHRRRGTRKGGRTNLVRHRLSPWTFASRRQPRSTNNRQVADDGGRSRSRCPSRRIEQLSRQRWTRKAPIGSYTCSGASVTPTRTRAIDALGRAGFAYDAKAERRAWAMAMSLLNEVFEPEPEANARTADL